ncbi:MAG TPA: sigma-70 family RNA polymerase sigma factor [Polyangia bacterium]|nr:sigma-70 family RNA polymerase sigma factor [Polyangia bacterium]
MVAAAAVGAPSSAEDVVARCKSGERRAFEELYFAYRRQVAAQLYRLIGPADLDDAVQEVFFEVWRSIGRFRAESKLSTWLYRLTVNVALRRLRTRKRREPPNAGDPDALPFGDTPERALRRKLALRRVQCILDQMAPKKRIVFVLHEIEGLEVAEIADIVRAPRVTVRTRLHYARKEFFRRTEADPAFDPDFEKEGL